ncbi:hypothetical protein L5F68_05560 [Aliarcobacter butzleri]|uniref:hypothetical protein n=1 Tax=Aliarcobacter butzleri TaxID=28197 RepID=UPI001EE0CD3B|nr:hypothetical protein [Aliarcobacter butzleri]MCG3703798.1 hypothetical protein [Aliarcobacter butzleri]
MMLKINNNQGFFQKIDGEYEQIDKITKEDLLRMMENILENDTEMEEYDEEKLKNQAHQVVYKSIYNNFKSLNDRKKEFKDNTERLYQEQYTKYVT